MSVRWVNANLSGRGMPRQCEEGLGATGKGFIPAACGTWTMLATGLGAQPLALGTGHWELSTVGKDTGMAEGTVHDHLGQPQADPREFRYCLKCPYYQLVLMGTCTQPTIGLDALFFSTINR